MWPASAARSGQLEPMYSSQDNHIYSGEKLKVVGRAMVRILWNSGKEQEELGLVVVDGKGHSLLGQNLLGRLKLGWRKIRMLNVTSDTLELVLAKHNL